MFVAQYVLHRLVEDRATQKQCSKMFLKTTQHKFSQEVYVAEGMYVGQHFQRVSLRTVFFQVAKLRLLREISTDGLIDYLE